ncbi:MAG: hypothetical protein JSS83_13700 [Cyanobacteria bacterium SZAS LIN-3]|nr:hypothetical protein [Cyanobacteria bacterium SZAS LIN-3]
MAAGSPGAAPGTVVAESGYSSGADKKVARVGPVNDLFLFDSKSLSQLAVGSSVVIATLLSIPDGVALIPSATSIVSWGLHIIGNWVIGAVLWFVGFGALVHVLRLISRGVIASDIGLKLSRFDRVVNWSDIQSISLEPNPFFTRIFSLKVPARKLTVYFRFTAKNKLLANVLFPNFIPSFFFDKETFDALVKAIFDKSQILPSSRLPDHLDDDYSVFAFRPEQLGTVRRTCRWQARQRVFVTCIIALSLVTFLGRKAAVHYSFNSGLKAYREGRIDKAHEFYDLSLKFDPTFAAAWNALGQCDFRQAETQLKDFSAARKDWTIALLCKPDFVEPKLNLARLAIYQRKFLEAADHIERAMSFDAQNTLALLDKAEIDVRRGKPAEGLKLARLVVSQTSSKPGVGQNEELAFLAHCVIAQGKLDLGDIAGAALELKGFSDDPADYNSGQNITYMYIVKSRIFAAQKLYGDAQKMAVSAVHRQPRNEEALAQAALVEVELGNYAQAEDYLARARALLVPDPWLSIAYGRQMIKVGNLPQALRAYADALVVPDENQDAFALASVYTELKAARAANGELEAKIPQFFAEIDRVVNEARMRALKINSQVFTDSERPAN